MDDYALTADDVAHLLHLSRNTVYKLARTGEMGSYRVGRKLYFTKQDVENYRAANRAWAAPREVEAPAEFLESGRVVGGERLYCPTVSSQGGIVLAGRDLAADVLANFACAAGVPIERRYENSYDGLVNLYRGMADAALVRLYDGKTNRYNVPYVQRLVPGTAVFVMHFLERNVGFLVAAGNPKRMRTWGALLREGIVMAVQHRGCADRILLDEKLVSMEGNLEEAQRRMIECPSARASVFAVAEGRADVALVVEEAIDNVRGLEFVPLQREWLDIVVVKNERTRRFRRFLKGLRERTDFVDCIERTTKGNPDDLGVIVYEC